MCTWRMIYDVIIIGAGPAGLSAAIYAGRARLNTILVEMSNAGGQIGTTAEVENYPGGPAEGESGWALAERMSKQAERFGAKRIMGEIISVQLLGDVKTATLSDGKKLSAKTIIIAAGATPRPIGCENENDFIGRGISFCATCDANFFRNKEVYVAGGGDSAIEEALHLTKFARLVTIIHRREEFRAAKSIQEKAFSNEKIRVIFNSVIRRVGGDGVLSEIDVRNVETGEITKLTADEKDGMFGLFVFLGTLPNSAIFSQNLPLEDGFIRTDEDMQTNIPGVFAAGDVRVKSFRQAVTAAADGAISALRAEKYLESVSTAKVGREL